MICTSGIGFDPRIDGERLTFGFRGIWQGTALLYERGTGSTWLHFTGACIDGVHKGRVLTPLSTGRHTTWAEWRATHPDTEVMKPEARYIGRPGDQGYFPRESAGRGQAFLPPGFAPTIQTRDARLPLHALVVGLRRGAKTRAIPVSALEATGVVAETWAGTPITVWRDPASGAVAAFEATVEGRPLTFRTGGDGRMQDAPGGSLWTFDGLCVDGPRKGTRLVRITHLLTEWYGWYAHHPETSLRATSR